MKERIARLLLILFIVVSLSGCLVYDNSTSLTVEGTRKRENAASELTKTFFSYNEYDSTTKGTNYESEKIISLFKAKGSGAVVTIDPIIGPKYDKSYDKLKTELQDQKTLFEAQKGYSYKLLFKNPAGEKSYEALISDGQFTNQTGAYDVLFQVFEEVEGKRILTDNGIITFELQYKGNDKWIIDHLLVDYRDLGSITLSDSE